MEKKSVALVDDERSILMSLGMALEAAGFRVRTYGDTASAFEALAAEPADVALLDYHTDHSTAWNYSVGFAHCQTCR